MRLFRNFTILSTVLTYILIFVGGMVRVAGAGMGCPDWPKCFDRWIPPTSIEQLPDHIDPAKFNIVLAWIEYGNRLFGALVGLSIAVTLYLGLKHCSHLPRIKWPLIAAFSLTLFEGWLGSVLVKTVLNPFTITLHLFFALIIVMLLVFVAQETYYISNIDAEKNSHYPTKMKFLFGLMAISLLTEVVLGTEIRGGLEMIRKDNPIVESQFLLDMLGPFKYAHTILGIAITILSVLIWFSLVKSSINPSQLMVQSSTLIIVLILIQIVTGEMLVFLKFMPVSYTHLTLPTMIGV